MMKVNISFIQDYNLNNKIFDISNKKINRDDYGYFYYKLKKAFESKNINLSTSDINLPGSSEIILYHGLNQKFIDYGNEKSYLLAIESPHVDIKSFNISYHKYFKKIFTWDDRLIDNKKYFKVNYAFRIPSHIQKKFENKKLCTTIASNKKSNHKNELYTKRVELIRWFEKNHLESFDLYGVGWDQRNFGSTFIGKVLNRITPLRKLFFKPFPSYKGTVDSKIDTFSQYKFAICYENIKDQPGYITEKIFDAFFAGCVPVYWGASNIDKYIPSECYIDKRKFRTYEKLYSYMINMKKDQYMQYLNSIENFLNSSKADPFRAETFATIIVNEIVKDLNVDS